MPRNLININDALYTIKTDIENAIRRDGTDGKNNLIRTQKPIKLLHEVVKAELIRKGIPQNCICPARSESNGELTLAGFFKTKDQDVCVKPERCNKVAEKMTLKGTLYGYQDFLWERLYRKGAFNQCSQPIVKYGEKLRHPL